MSTGRRAFVAGALAALAAAALAAPAAAQDKPLRLGYSVAKTGLFAEAGAEQNRVYELWRDQVNARGGLDVGGKGRRRIELVSYDDQSVPGNAVKIYEKLITDDKVDLLLAPWGTPFHIAIAPVVERYKFPLVGATAASAELRKLKPGYIWFPTAAMPDRVGEELAKFLSAQGVKTAAVLTNQLPFGMEVRTYLMPALQKAGIKVVSEAAYPPDVKDMTAMLAAVKAANPDAVVALSYPPDSVLYLKQAREVGVGSKLQLLLIGPSIPFFRPMFGAAADGIVTLGHWAPNLKDTPRARQFFDAYVAKYGKEPDYLSSSDTQASLEILEQAVAKAGLDKEQLRKVIGSTTFDTTMGPVRFEGVQNVVTPAGFMQIQGSKIEIVWPQSRATSAFKPRP